MNNAFEFQRNIKHRYCLFKYLTLSGFEFKISKNTVFLCFYSFVGYNINYLRETFL